MYNYIKNGADIYRRSFSIIRAEAKLETLPKDMEKIAVRMIHACGRIEIAQNIAFSENAGTIGREALKNGASILCDSKMVMQGITKKRLPAKNEIFCSLEHEDTENLAKQLGTTRSAAALEFWRPKLNHSIAVIGNAPTALFHLLEMIEQGAPRPKLIIGVPVGFVGAAESKEALLTNPYHLPFITLLGRQGGSAMAVAALNALAQEEEF